MFCQQRVAVEWLAGGQQGAADCEVRGMLLRPESFQKIPVKAPWTACPKRTLAILIRHRFEDDEFAGP